MLINSFRIHRGLIASRVQGERESAAILVNPAGVVMERIGGHVSHVGRAQMGLIGEEEWLEYSYTDKVIA